MGKNLLTGVLTLGFIASAAVAAAQVYRYDPKTGGSQNLSGPAQSAKSPTLPTAPQRPGAAKPVAPDMAKVQKAITSEKSKEIRTPDGISTNDLVGAVNKSIADEQKNSERKMLPLGRIGIIINPQDYNPTIDRNIGELNKIADLDKLYMNPPTHVGNLLYLMKWQSLENVEFMADNRGLVQQKFNIKIPGFAYLRPDGTHTAYSLDDLAPFYEALTVQRRKVGK